jgi:hypothetical protein
MGERPIYQEPYSMRLSVYTIWLQEVCEQTGKTGTFSVNHADYFSWTVRIGEHKVNITLEPDTETMLDESAMKELFRRKLEEAGIRR